MIIALAGRRIDGADAKEVRFPLRNVDIVRMRVRAFLQDKAATALVSSAACGADLIGLSEAGQLGIRRRVILPFERRRFKQTSVTDRPGEWGTLYESVLAAVEPAGDLLILQNGPDDDAYSLASRAVLDQALALSMSFGETATALLVWDGASRGSRDLTEQFGAEARRRGLQVAELLTT